ncbi:conserved hypothetical protein [Vibrio crassostreae]|nr:conserved hypothetical protein [Vibrio crassostreae]CAK3310412.1 conserved hypothetical protein [Vibrio crassostreae]CAK3780528.1 conserved hypothetical protein [Vibrio crassostreae]
MLVNFKFREKSSNKWLKKDLSLVSVEIRKQTTEELISMRKLVMNIHHHHHPI